MPPLEKRVHSIPIATGPDDSINPHLRDVAQLSLMENCHYTKDGKLSRRPGQTIIGKDTSDGDELDQIYSIHESGGQLLAHARSDATSRDKLWTWNESNDQWVDVGRCAQAEVSTSPLRAGVDSLYWCDVARKVSGDNEWICYAVATKDTTSTNAIYGVVLVDGQTGAVIAEEMSISGLVGAVACGVCALNGTDKFVAVFRIAQTVSVRVISGLSSTPAVGALTSISGSLSELPVNAYEHATVVEAAENDLFGVIFRGVSGDIICDSFNSALALQATVKTTPAAAPYSFSATAAGNSDTTYVTYWDQTDFKVWGIEGDMSAQKFAPVTVVGSVTAMTSVHGSCEDTSDGSLRVCYTQRIDPKKSEYCVIAAKVDPDGNVTGVIELCGQAVVVAGPFYYDGATYVWAHQYSPTGTNEDYTGVGSLMCIRTEHAAANDRYIVARALVDQHSAGEANPVAASFATASPGLFCRRVVQRGTSSFSAPFLRAEAVGLTGGTDDYDTSLLDLKVDVARTAIPTAEVDGSLFLGAGVPMIFDGKQVRVCGMEMQHPDFQLTGAASGGNLTDGDYGVAIIYRWVDAKGRVYYSAATYDTITLGGGGGSQQIQVYESGTTTWYTFHNTITDKPSTTNRSDVSILFFRTLVGGGSVYYYDGAADNDSTATPGTVQYTFTAADATISSNATLYEDSGEVPTVLPPTPLHVASDGDTVALVPGDRRETIWVAKPVTIGYGIQFSYDLVYYVPGGGDITAIQFMDGRLIVFKERQIRYMVGSPPNALAEGGYATSELVAKGVGCEGWRSVMMAPMGIVFKGASGFHLLSRDLSVQYIGGPVEDYNGQTVVSSTFIEGDREIRFCMSGGDVLAWDYERNVWATFTGLSPSASAFWDGSWIVAKADATIGKEGGSVDYGASSITWKFRTGWLMLSGIRGYQRVRRVHVLGQAPADVNQDDTVTVKSYLDFNDADAAETLVNAGSWDVKKNRPVEMRITLGTQKCGSLMIEFQVVSASDVECMTLSALGFEFGAKRGAPRLSASRTG